MNKQQRRGTYKVHDLNIVVRGLVDSWGNLFWEHKSVDGTLSSGVSPAGQHEQLVKKRLKEVRK